MGGRIYVGIDLEDVSVLIDDVSDPPIESEHWNSVRGAVRGRDLLVGIEQQRKRQVVFLDEFLVRVGRIDAASEHRQPGVAETRVAIAKGARFFGASRGLVLGVEIENNFSAVEV